MNFRFARTRRAGLAAATALSLCAVLVTSSLAIDAVDDGDAIVVNPGSNFVELAGYPPNTDLQVEVKRGGVVVGSTTKRTTSGDLEINHLGGGDCWDPPATPDIKGGDEIVVTVIDEGVPIATDSANVRDIQLDSAETVGDTIVLSGHASSHPDAALGSGTVTAAIRMPDFGDFRADRQISTEGPFTVVFDEADGVTPEVAQEWADNPARADVTWVNAGETITTLADFGGDPPVAGPDCPPLASNDITTRSHQAVNAGNVTTDMTVGGVSAPNVAAVQLSINGTDVGTPATPGPDGIWQGTVPAAALQNLAEGEFELGATFDGADPAGETVLKDTVIPGQPTATPPAGAYTSSQFVSLNAAADVVQVRWTNGPGDPTQVYDGSAIPVSASQTLKAVAVDAGGNESGVASFAYVIRRAPCPSSPEGCGDAPPGPLPTPENPPGGGGGILVQDPVLAFRVRSLRAPGRLSLSTARRRGVTARFLAPEGARFVRASLFLHTKSSARGRRLLKRLTFAVDGSGRYAARFTDRRTRRKLRRGVYTLSIAPGTDSTTFADGTAKRFRIR